MPYRSVLRDNLFQHKTIVITGGGSGIGRCTAHELASLGANVVIFGRVKDKLQTVCAEIEEDGGSAVYHVCDVRKEQQVVASVTAVVEQYQRIDGLVNNAGGQFPSNLADISLKGWEAVLQTNLTGGFLMAREVYNQSMKQHGGAIVNMLADMWGGMPGMGHSGAARAGMDNLTKTAAYEWAASGVRVNAVAPGWIISSGMDSYPPELLPVIQSLQHAIPQQRMGREAEVSSAICYLLSEGAAFVNGTTVRIDGAASLGNRVYPLADHDNKQHYDGFHREHLPDIAKNLT